MDRLTEILQQVENFDTVEDATLAELEVELLEEIRPEILAQPTTAETVELLRQLADAVEAVRTEAAERFAAAEEITRLAQEQLDRLGLETGDPDPETDDETVEEPEAEIVVEDAPAPEPEPAREPVAATTRTPARTRPATAAPIGAVAGAQRTPQAQTPSRGRGNGRPAVRMEAAPDLSSFATGQLLDWDAANHAMLEMIDATRGSQGEMKRRVATVNWRDQYPEERYLREEMDVSLAAQRYRDVVMPGGQLPMPGSSQPTNLVAATGICVAPDIRYDVVDLATDERPLRNGLPGFRADRGGLTWYSSPKVEDVVVDNTNGAIDTTTPAVDGAKTIQEFTCPTATTRQIVAFSERITFGNFADRYHPENMRGVMAVARAAWARRAERALLTTMKAQSLLLNAGGAAQPVGAWPKFFAILARAARGYRYQYRIPEDATLRVVLQTWVLDKLFIDLLYQAPGDGLTAQRIAIRQAVTAQLADLNIVPIWGRDDAESTDANGVPSPAFANVTAAGNLTDYPTLTSALLFHEGAFLFLDGGTLDFGIVRDSATLAANKWQTFFESFEQSAMVGYASWDLSISLCASGTRAALATVDCDAIGS